MTPDRIAELRALAEKATPGPWDFDGVKGGSQDIIGPELHDRDLGRRLARVQVPVANQRDGTTGANTAFIAAARTALPEALDAIERVRKACEIGSYVDHEWSPAGVRVIMVSEILAALNAKSE